jgi:hypothetical protein
MATRKANEGAAEPGTAIGNQAGGGGPSVKRKEGGGQRSSKERGTATNHKKNPGKRPRQGGSSA